MSNLFKSKFLLGVVIVAVMFVGAVVLNATPAAADCSITSTLRVGSTGEQVKCLQSIVGATADGKFGPLTKASVMAWQSGHSLVADGVVGPLTRAVLNTGSPVSGNLPSGCSSTVGYSPTTGQSCSTGVSTTFPAGCTSTVGYSPTTGQLCSGSTTVVVVPTTGVVTVSLASDNPAAGTLLIDDTTGVMQNAAPVAKFVFSNGTGSEVKVNTVKLTRTGIASDGDINNLFLYEGNTKLAELSSVSTKVFSFNSSAGLFSIPANSSKAVWVGINMAVAESGPTSVGFKINSSADVVLSSGATAGGSFPIMGNEFATAFITDLGYVSLSSTTTYPATLDPKPEAQELWRFTATGNSQKMEIKKIVLTMVGTIAPGDIQDLALSVGGVQIGSVAQLGSDNKVTFDWSGSPYSLLSGQAKTFVLNGKVVKGTGRAFKFTIRSTADFVSTDTNYLADTVPLNGSSALTVIDPDSSGDGTNINNGSLTVSRSSNSPSGNIASGALDVPLARFDYRANGEDIKVSYVSVSLDQEASDFTWNEGALYFNGSLVGTKFDLIDETAHIFSLGNTVIIPAGTTGVFEVRSNVEKSDGTDILENQTVVVSLNTGASGDAIGQTSLTSLTPSGASGQTLTVKSGVLTEAKNTSVADATTVNSTGVRGATNVKVGSLVLTAGAGEAVNITQIVVGDDLDVTTSEFGANFQNLTLRNGSSTSTPIATVQGSLSTTEGADYTFSLSPSVTIAAGAQYVVDLYADILTSAIAGGGTYAAAEVGLEFVSASATGVNTSASASVTGGTGNADYDLQKVVISDNGSLVVTVNASTPAAAQLVIGETGQTLAMLDFAAGSAENVNVSVITITDTSSFAGSLANIKLYDGSTLLGTIASFSAQSNGTATFNLASDWVIPKNTTKTLTIKADVNSYGAAVSGGAHTINVASAANITTRGSQSGVAIDEDVTVGTISHKVYRTKVTAEKGASSPSGTAVVSATSNVLEFTVAANSAYDAVVNVVAVTMSGSVDTTSTGSAVLYKSTDLSTALATEAYVTAAADSGTTTTFVVADAASLNGIPVGATVRISDDTDASIDTTKVTAIDGVTMTVSPAVTDVDAGDDLYYRPLQPGTGKLFFGAQTTITADLATTDTTIAVASADGFSTGDVVTFAGYNSTGVLCSGTGTLTSITATLLTATGQFTVDCSSGTDTIVSAYLSGTAANAITNSQNGVAIVHTGLVNTTGQVVSAGTTATFVVKGDTTGATADETLRADIAAVGDLNWDDKTSFGVITVTKNLPITGGTLTY